MKYLMKSKLKSTSKMKIISNSLLCMIGNMLIKGVVFLTIPIFTRMLTTEEFGMYNTYVAFQSICAVFIGLGLSGCIKNGKIDYDFNYNGFVYNIVLFNLLSFIVLFGISGCIFLLIIKNSKYIALFICIMISSFLNSILDIFTAKWVIESRYGIYFWVALSNILLGSLNSIFLIKYVFVKDKYFGRILGELVPLTIIIVLLLVVFMVKNATKIRKDYIRYGLKISLPLIPHILSKILLIQFDRLMLTKMVNAAITGIYSCMYNLSSILNVILNSLDMVWISWFYKNMKEKQYNKIKKFSQIYILFFMTVCIGFSFVLPEILYIFAPKEYYIGIKYAYILSLVVYVNFMYLFYINLEFYNKDTGYASVGTVLSAVINIILNAFLIKIYQAEGAAISTLLSYGFLFLIHVLICKRKYKLDVFDLRILIGSLIVIVLIMILAFILRHNFILRLVIMIFTVAVEVGLIIRKVRKNAVTF